MGIADKRNALKLDATEWKGVLELDAASPDDEFRAGMYYDDDFWVGVYVGRHAPDDAEAAGDLLEELGQRPYKRGDAGKNRTEKAPVYHLPVRGQ
jgi:hypothetical protein